MITEDLFSFAYCFDFPTSLKQLSEMAIPEPWQFLDPQYEYSNVDTPILERYIRNIFRHQAICANHCADPAERSGYFFLRGMLACIHTGLVTPQLEGIYALFELNRKGNTKCDWILTGFYPASSPRLRCIPVLPSAPRFYSESRGFHPEWDVCINFAHILQEPRNNSRLPSSIQDMRNKPLLLQAAVQYGRTLAEVNPSNVAAQLYCGKVQYLLPICLTDMGRCDLALTLTPQNGYYVGHTCLTLEMSYHNARMLGRPSANWLLGLVDRQTAEIQFPYRYIYGL